MEYNRMIIRTLQLSRWGVLTHPDYHNNLIVTRLRSTFIILPLPIPCPQNHRHIVGRKMQSGPPRGSGAYPHAPAPRAAVDLNINLVTPVYRCLDSLRSLDITEDTCGMTGDAPARLHILMWLYRILQRKSCRYDFFAYLCSP